MIRSEHGWGRVLLALALVLFIASALGPLPNVLALLIPAIAALMLAAWRQGGNGFTALAWSGLALWAAARAPGTLGGLGALETGVGLLVAVAFGSVSLARPAWPFLPRALGAVAVGLAAATAVGASAGLSPSQIGALVRDRYAEAAQLSAQGFVRFTEAQFKGQPRTPDVTAAMDQARQFADQWTQLFPATAAAVAPALVALEALVALALAWGLFHRLSRTRVGPPLAKLAEFRFSDVLVWGMIAGIALIVMPGLASLRGVAANLLVFFGALYAVRGLAVLWFFATPGPVLTAVAVLAGVLFSQVVLPTAACLGLSDTWIDWRRRASAPTP